MLWSIVNTQDGGQRGIVLPFRGSVAACRIFMCILQDITKSIRQKTRCQAGLRNILLVISRMEFSDASTLQSFQRTRSTTNIEYNLSTHTRFASGRAWQCTEPGALNMPDVCGHWDLANYATLEKFFVANMELPSCSNTRWISSYLPINPMHYPMCLLIHDVGALLSQF